MYSPPWSARLSLRLPVLMGRALAFLHSCTSRLQQLCKFSVTVGISTGRRECWRTFRPAKLTWIDTCLQLNTRAVRTQGGTVSQSRNLSQATDAANTELSDMRNLSGRVQAAAMHVDWGKVPPPLLRSRTNAHASASRAARRLVLVAGLRTRV